MASLLFLFLLSYVINPLSVEAIIPSLYVFGDSTADVGNNNYLSDKAPKANFPYYGIDFPGRTATGRFTNGFVSVDYIARFVGLPRSPPAFLSNTNGGLKWLRGVNFASAGSGISKTLWIDVIDIDEQIKNFKLVAADHRTRVGNRTTDRTISKSLFCFSTGSNDLFALFQSLDPTNKTLENQMIESITNKFQDQLTMLYSLGARRFVVFGTGFLGCIPEIRKLVPGNNCLEDLNNLSLHFKNATKSLLQSLSSNLPGFKYTFGDVYEMLVPVFANPLQYGFREMKAPCCPPPCTLNSTYCRNRQEYYNWDSFHPTEAVYRMVAKLTLFGPPRVANPINILGLVNT
ncbi:GDSL esterase/lipase At4g16230-like [Typha angustifolia]|uniref:GDSL esterase/lipase At4g16230-like n=1 Tax=Typha angustifolia TaxID=59011 RepID=UPI003C2B2FCD